MSIFDENSLTIISADGVALGHLTSDDELIVDTEICGACIYEGSYYEQPSYCDNDRPCPTHGDWWNQEESDEAEDPADDYYPHPPIIHPNSGIRPGDRYEGLYNDER